MTTPPSAASERQAAGLRTGLDSRLGEYVHRDTALFLSLGWETLVTQRHGRGDLTSMSNVPHPARRLLRHLASKGAPAVTKTPAWTSTQLSQAVRRGPHKSCQDQESFIRSEFADFVDKWQWIVC
jgi:hypothetical protein